MNIESSTFDNSRYKFYGGAVYVEEVHYSKIKSCKFDQIKYSAFCMFENCVATDTGGSVAIEFVKNYSVINLCTYIYNKADIGGAVYISNHHKKRHNINMYISNTNFVNNTATGIGQVLYNNIDLHLTNIQLKIQEIKL